MTHREKTGLGIHSLDSYRFDGMESILTPSLVIYPDMVEANIKTTLGLLHGNADLWRPHVKTAKLSFVMDMFLQHGIMHFKAATTLELLTLCKLGAPDVLLAHPALGAKQRRVVELAQQYPNTKISVIVETAEGAETWKGFPVGIFVDVNPGMNRTGVSKERVLAVLAAVGMLPAFRGVHYYDGHVNAEDEAERTRQAHLGYAELVETILRIQSFGIAVPEVVTSGTTTFLSAVAYPEFAKGSFTHRVSPGTVVYCDMTSLRNPPAVGFVPAALVLSTVVSHPGKNRVTCDAGHKSVSADAGIPTCEVMGNNFLVPRDPSEEHLPIDVTAGIPPAVGDQLFLVPRHICPTVNNFDHAILVRNGRIQGVEQVTARGREGPIVAKKL